MLNGLRKLIKSFKYAFSGLNIGIKKEQNMQIHILAVIVVTILGIVFKIDKTEWMICLILFGIVISAELFNTAIETVVDISMPEINEKAKIAKDVSAAAVLILAIISIIIGGMIFIPKII